MNVMEKTGPKHLLSQVVIYIILVFFAFMALYPLFWLFFSSFKTTQEYQLTSKLALPQVWWWRNYLDAWVRGRFGTLFLNSIIYTGVSTIVILYCSIAAGFAFSKLPAGANNSGVFIFILPFLF